MADNTRILAVEIDNSLFDDLDNYVKKNGLSKKQFVAGVLRESIADGIKQEQEISEPEITGIKTWDRTEVEKAIDNYITQYGKVPSQKDFRNENGLPSYNAATRALVEITPSQYANQRYIEIHNIVQNTGLDSGPNMNM